MASQAQEHRVLFLGADCQLAGQVDRQLKPLGCAVAAACDDPDDLDRLLAEAVDLVLIDLDQREPDGVELARRVGDLAGAPPFIVVSRRGNPARLAEAMRLGATNCLLKEPDGRFSDLLPLMVERALDRRQGRRNGQDRRNGVSVTAGVSEQRFQSIYEHAPMGIVITDGKALIECNPAFQAMLGYSAAELARLGISGITHAEDMARELPLLEALLAGTRDKVALEKRYRCRDGTLMWARVVLAPIKNRSGRVDRLVAMVEDVTQGREQLERLARSEAQAQAARAAAELANQAKSQFLATLSHEIRTPLNSIIGFAEIIAGEMFGPCHPSRYLDYARDIQASGEHLMGVINDVLDLAKIEAGRFELQEDVLEPDRVVRSATRLITERAASHGLEVAIEQSPLLPRMRGDVRAIRQMVLNLLGNAIKFTPPGGRILVRIQPAAEGGLILAVSDTGIGIAAQDIPKALAPFGQLFPPPGENSMVRRQSGTGLGLPLVKNLIELHGGRLEISSTPGQGTTVALFFPRDRCLPA